MTRPESMTSVHDMMRTRWTSALPHNWPGDGRAEKKCCLVCIYPTDRLGQIVELNGGEVLIGRDAGCNVELPDDSVSRRHALIRPSDLGYVVVDLGSTNGTFVNDIRIELQELEPGDRIRFGNQILKFLSADCLEAEYFENAYRMMTTDGLTQAHNKRYLFDVIERELRRQRRTGRPLSVLMIDIDRFKSVNDTLGHLAGDEVLIEVSRRLRANLRGDEILARYGGEEFALMLPDTSLNDATSAAERVRAVVASSPFPTDHAEVSVTVSIGAAAVEPPQELTATELIERADKQLYAAKRAGRNRVMG